MRIGVRIRGAWLPAILFLFAWPAALAGERGIVANSGGQLKAEPKPKGKNVERLKQGTLVDVVDHSGDGQWLKVVYGGPDGGVEGWVEKGYVRSMSRYGFSWERKDSKGGGKPVPEPAGAPDERAKGKKGSGTTGGAGDATGWDAAPAGDADAGWGDASTPGEDADWGAAPTPTSGDDGTIDLTQ